MLYIHMHESVVVTRGNYKSIKAVNKDFGPSPPNTKILSRKQLIFFVLIDLCMYHMYLICLEVGKVHTKERFSIPKTTPSPLSSLQNQKKKRKKERGKHTPID